MSGLKIEGRRAISMQLARVMSGQSLLLPVCELGWSTALGRGDVVAVVRLAGDIAQTGPAGHPCDMDGQRKATPQPVSPDRRQALADGRDRVADQREALADQRDRVADQRETLADEQERLAEERERMADERDRRQGERERLADERERRADLREQRQDQRA